jgi:hypothetical protein
MPIEDVQFLVENSAQDSSLIFIDSSKRDRQHHATPSEYVVEFEEPLKNVFGMDVLDATIPGTMYNVDTHNNTLVVMTCDVELSAACVLARYGLDTPEAVEQAEAAAVAADMYTLGFSADVNRIFSGGRDAYLVVMSADVFDQNPPPGSPYAGSDSGPRYAAIIKHTLPAVPLFMPQGSLAMSEPGAFQHNNAVYAAVAPAQNSALLARLATFGPTPDFALVPSALPWHASPFFGVTAPTRLYDIIYYTVQELTKAQHTAYVSSYGVPMYPGVPPLSLSYVLRLTRVVVEPGNYTSVTLQAALQDIMFQRLGISILSTSSGTVDKQGLYRFSCRESQRYLFSIKHSTAGTLLGFDLHASLTQNLAPLAERMYNAVSFGADTRPWFMSVRKTAADGTLAQVLDSPGLVNLLGVRYITLRCKEFEEHLGTTGKYGAYSTGIGVFKLASASEVAQLRFDFVSLIRKPFHPIGKLQRMTLRFERTSGELYDFKGVNHQILMTIKYYSPVRKAAFADRILNPDYNPDFMSYVTKQARAAARAARLPGFESSSASEAAAHSDRESETGSQQSTDDSGQSDSEQESVP